MNVESFWRIYFLSIIKMITLVNKHDLYQNTSCFAIVMSCIASHDDKFVLIIIIIIINHNCVH